MKIIFVVLGIEPRHRRFTRAHILTHIPTTQLRPPCVLIATLKFLNPNQINKRSNILMTLYIPGRIRYVNSEHIYSTRIGAARPCSQWFPYKGVAEIIL